MHLVNLISDMGSGHVCGLCMYVSISVRKRTYKTREELLILCLKEEIYSENIYKWFVSTTSANKSNSIELDIVRV
jgi:hypothetical protein